MDVKIKMGRDEVMWPGSLMRAPPPQNRQSAGLWNKSAPLLEVDKR